MTSYRLLEDGSQRLVEDGTFRILEDGSTTSIVGTAQWACRNLTRRYAARRLTR